MTSMFEKSRGGLRSRSHDQMLDGLINFIKKTKTKCNKSFLTIFAFYPPLLSHYWSLLNLCFIKMIKIKIIFGFKY